MIFTLSIASDNDEMRTADDVANALSTVAGDLAAGRTEGSIRDVNGNTVGGFKLTIETCEGCGRPLDDLDAPGAACDVCGAAGDDNDEGQEG